jgi:hypothetical protein
MELRNRKIASLTKHQNKMMFMNKQHFENNNDNKPKGCTYIDPDMVGCKNLIESDNSINLIIFLRNIFIALMICSLTVALSDSSSHKNNYVNINKNNYVNINKYELVNVKPDYNLKNMQGLKIVSMIFSTNKIKNKLVISRNLNNFYKLLVQMDNDTQNISVIYPKWLNIIQNYTNSSMLKIDEYFLMQNGNISNTHSLFRYNTYKPTDFLTVNIIRNHTIYNRSFYPYLIVI